jgi:hypothetical protein
MGNTAVSLWVRVRSHRGWGFFEPVLDVQQRPKKGYWGSDDGKRTALRLDDSDAFCY